MEWTIMVLTYDQIIFGLGIEVFGLIGTYFIFRRIKRGYKQSFRRLDALDGIEESVKNCAKQGKRMALGVLGALSGVSSPDVAAGFALYGYTARLCAKYGVDPSVPITGTAETVPVHLNILEASYAAEGKTLPNLRDRVRQISITSGSDYSAATAYQGFMARENIGGSAFFGAVQMYNPVLSDIDGISIQATSQTIMISTSAVLCDYSLLGDHLYAGGAMVSGEPLMVSSIVVSDILKLGFVILTVIGLVIHFVAPGVTPF